jgi:hypothetical protein
MSQQSHIAIAGSARHGWAWRGTASQAWPGEARLGEARRGIAGSARHGWAWRGTASQE